MKLIHSNSVIGIITSPSQDGPWMSGDLNLESSVGPEYREFFAFMVDEDQGDTDPPFGPEFLDASNWFIEEDDGTRRGIEIPAVHNDDSIMWRWR